MQFGACFISRFSYDSVRVFAVMEGDKLSVPEFPPRPRSRTQPLAGVRILRLAGWSGASSSWRFKVA